MNKRIIVILGLIILLSFGAGAVLLIGQRKFEKPTPATTKPEIKKLVDESVISPVSSFDGSAIWYFNSGARLFRLNTDGEALTEFPLPGLGEGDLVKVLWSKEGSDFIAQSSTSQGRVNNYYDSVLQKYVQLPQNILSLDWMPDGKRIIYIWKSADSQQLKIASADSSGFLPVADVFWADYVVKVSPKGEEALLYRSEAQGGINKIYRVNLKTKQFDTVVDNGINSAALWLPGGEKFIFAQSTAPAHPRLLMYNFSNRQITDLNLATSIDKITVDGEGKMLYAAVPKKSNTGDEFIRLDLVTLKQDSYYQPEADVRAKNLLEIKSKLYFVNSRDGKLYYVVK